MGTGQAGFCSQPIARYFRIRYIMGNYGATLRLLAQLQHRNENRSGRTDERRTNSGICPSFRHSKARSESSGAPAGLRRRRSGKELFMKNLAKLALGAAMLSGLALTSMPASARRRRRYRHRWSGPSSCPSAGAGTTRAPAIVLALSSPVRGSACIMAAAAGGMVTATGVTATGGTPAGAIAKS